MHALRYCLVVVSAFAASAAVAEEPMTWRFLPGDGFAAAILTNCDECDYIEMVVNCAEGSGEVEAAIAIHVDNGNPGETRNVTFLFGDGAIDRKAVLVANEMDVTTEPSVNLAADDEILTLMQQQDMQSLEVLVENGPSKTVSLSGAAEALAQFLPLCGKGG